MLPQLSVGLLFLAAHVAGQDCKSAGSTTKMLSNYLGCLKQSLDSNYESLENEFHNDNRKMAETCFAATTAQARETNHCFLAPAEFNTLAWDNENGPLRSCEICRAVASALVKGIFESPEDEQKCFRDEISKAAARESNVCIRKHLPEFTGVPQIPDLEEGAFHHKELVMKTISDSIVVHDRLATCAKRNPERDEATRDCLATPFDGFMTEHCKVTEKCDAEVSEGCGEQIRNARDALCACYEESRRELVSRASSLVNALKNAVRGKAGNANEMAKVCLETVKEKMTTTANNWLVVVDETAHNCMKKKPDVGLETLIAMACKRVLSNASGNGLTDLNTGLNFLGNLANALIDRFARFCSEPCDS